MHEGSQESGQAGIQSGLAQVDSGARGNRQQVRQLAGVRGLMASSGDIIEKPIPIRPVAHYSMGGIETDINGLTRVKNVWAAGGSTRCKK
jgi:succinate dehydrogenase/fumarate reductase flavoprotein subunit